MEANPNTPQASQSPKVDSPSVGSRITLEQLGIIVLIVGLFWNWMDVADRINELKRNIAEVEARIQQQIDRRFDESSEQVDYKIEGIKGDIGALAADLKNTEETVENIRVEVTRLEQQSHARPAYNPPG